MVQPRVDVLKDTGRGVAAELFREIEVLKLALSKERVSRTITRCANVAGVFVDEMDCEAQDLVSNEPASPRRDGETGPTTQTRRVTAPVTTAMRLIVSSRPCGHRYPAVGTGNRRLDLPTCPGEPHHRGRHAGHSHHFRSSLTPPILDESYSLGALRRLSGYCDHFSDHPPPDKCRTRRTRSASWGRVTGCSYVKRRRRSSRRLADSRMSSS